MSQRNATAPHTDELVRLSGWCISLHCQINAGTWTRLFLPLKKRLQVFSSQLEREPGLQTQAHEYETGMCDQLFFFPAWQKRGKIEPAQLEKSVFRFSKKSIQGN